jgi:hypothetical protein
MGAVALQKGKTFYVSTDLLNSLTSYNCSLPVLSEEAVLH